MFWARSVDPGAVHVGIARWVQLEGDLWECVEAVETTYEQYVADILLVELTRPSLRPSKVVMEGFWLKPGKAALQQAGSSLETVELIGATKAICQQVGIPFVKVANGQDAIIKRLTANGYRWVSRGHGGHAKDAEAVGVRGLDLSVTQIVSCVEARGSR